ncbi:transposase, partial [Streptococcus suis]|nr:transposase [Streptococcus suis]
LSYSDELRQHYELYQFLLFHFQEKNSDHFFSLIEQEIATVNPNSNAKLEATNNLIKVIKRNAFGFRNFENFKKRILIALNIKKEKTKLVLSRC